MGPGPPTGNAKPATNLFQLLLHPLTDTRLLLRCSFFHPVRWIKHQWTQWCTAFDHSVWLEMEVGELQIQEDVSLPAYPSPKSLYSCVIAKSYLINYLPFGVAVMNMSLACLQKHNLFIWISEENALTLFPIFHFDFQWKMLGNYFDVFTCIYTRNRGNK